MGFFSSPKEKTVFVIDIGSSSVSAAFVQLRDGTTPKVLVSKRKEIDFQEDFSYERFLSFMLKAVAGVSDELGKREEAKHVKEIFCFLASPWYASQTRYVEISKDEPFTITQKFVDKLTESEIKAFEKEQKKKHEHLKENAPTVLEHETMRMVINGYEVDEFVGKKVRSLELALYVSMAPGKILTAIEEQVSRHLGNRHVTFATFPFAVYAVTSDFFPENNNLMFLDVTGEVTDVALVKNGVLKEVSSFPLGKNFLLRSVMKGMKASAHEATTYLSLFPKDELASKEKEKMTEILDQAKDEWMTHVQDITRDFASEAVLSKYVLFTSDEDVSWWFESIMDGKGFSDILGREIDIKFLSRTFMSHFCAFNTQVERESFLTIEAVFLNKLV